MWQPCGVSHGASRFSVCDSHVMCVTWGFDFFLVTIKIKYSILGHGPPHRKIYKFLLYFAVVLYWCETWSLTLREERRLRVFENIWA
jgi:hypothetical protein